MIGKLVTFGVVPTRPETGYGYIQRGEPISGDAFTIGQFVEKQRFLFLQQVQTNLETAQKQRLLNRLGGRR